MQAFSVFHICDGKIVPVVLLHLPHPISSSIFFQPNLLLWVSAHGILSPLRLQQLLRTVRYREIKWVSAAPWRNPTCLSASSSCCGLWSTLFCYPAESHRVQPGSCTCQPMYGVFQTSWLLSSLMQKEPCLQMAGAGRTQWLMHVE